MRNEYIIVMNQFVNGGVENLFISISRIRNTDIFYLVILNNNVDEKKIEMLPPNVKIVECSINNKFKRFFYLSKFIKNQLKHVKIMIDFHEVLQSEIFMLANSKHKICIHWFNSNPYMRLNRNKHDIYFKLYAFYRKTICICESQKEILMQVLPKLKTSQLYVSNNFIDIESVVKKAKTDVPLNYRYIVMISRIDFGAKDFKTVVKAFEKLPIEIKDEYKMVFVGDGPDFDKLKRLVNNSSDRNNFYLTGNQTNPYPYIKNAEIFIQSSFSEGFSLTTLEAWTIGCPVILSDFLCSARELSSNEETALIFEIGNISQLSEKMELLLKNQSLRDSLIDKGQKKCELYYREGSNSLNKLFDKGFMYEI